MSLELLYKPKYLASHPLSFFILVCVLLSVSIITSILFTQESASLLFLCFCVFLILPLFIQLLTDEETSFSSGIFALRKHPIIKLYIIFVVASFATILVWYLSSSPAVSHVLFFEQITFLSQTKQSFFMHITGLMTQKFTDSFVAIFINNFKVLNYIFFASLIFGAGALFILLWNTSVLSVAVGQKLQLLSASSSSISDLLIKAVIYLISLSFYVIFEFGAYILIAIAASIAAIAVIRHRFDSNEFRTILKDVVTLYLICVGMILIGALLESATLL